MKSLTVSKKQTKKSYKCLWGHWFILIFYYYYYFSEHVLAVAYKNKLVIKMFTKTSITLILFKFKQNTDL